jgi:hypothetical protein
MQASCRCVTVSPGSVRNCDGAVEMGDAAGDDERRRAATSHAAATEIAEEADCGVRVGNLDLERQEALEGARALALLIEYGCAVMAGEMSDNTLVDCDSLRRPRHGRCA